MSDAMMALREDTFMDLLDRARELLRVHFPTTVTVPFTWLHSAVDVEERYLAKMEWPADGCEAQDAPRVAVYCERSGELVCASMAGNFSALNIHSCRFPDHPELVRRRDFLRQIGLPPAGHVR